MIFLTAKHHQQQGVALLTVLLMVALASVVAAGIAIHERHSLENTQYVLRQNQALLYARSAEAFFAELLQQDRDNSPNLDHLNESWAKPMPVYPVEDGYVSGVLRDQTGLFDLNSLLKADGSVNVAAQQWFGRLLVRVGLPADLSQAVIDWQDSNQDTSGALGAEDDYYRGLNPAYLAANQPFHQVDELKLVRGFEQGQFERIAPFVTALPVAAKLNINTAPAMVLASIDPSIDLAALTQQLQQQQKQLKHFENTEALWQLAAMQNVDPANKQQVTGLLAVTSCCFNAEIEVMMSGRKRQLNSAILRKDQQTFIYARTLAPITRNALPNS